MMKSEIHSQVADGTTTEELLSAYLRKDDEAAFAEIYRRHARMVYSVSHRFVRSEADAEDVATACFAVLAQKGASLKGRNIAGWLYWRAMTMAGNLVKMNSRRAAREERLAEMNTDRQMENEDADRLLCAVEREIARLPDKQREAIVLQYYQGKSGAEIAAAMHCARGAVAVLVHRGMQKLRARLARVGMGDLDLESSLSSSALLLPVPAGIWAKLSEVLSGQFVDGPVVELVKGAMREMLAAKAKVVAAVVGVTLMAGGAGGLAVTMGRFAPEDRPVPAQSAAKESPVAAPATGEVTYVDGPVIFEDDFEHGLEHWEVGQIRADAAGEVLIGQEPFVAKDGRHIDVGTEKRDGRDVRGILMTKGAKREVSPFIGLKRKITAPAYAVEWEYKVWTVDGGSEAGAHYRNVSAEETVVSPIPGQQIRRVREDAFWQVYRSEVTPAATGQKSFRSLVKVFHDKKRVAVYRASFDNEYVAFTVNKGRVFLTRCTIRELVPARRGSEPGR